MFHPARLLFALLITVTAGPALRAAEPAPPPATPFHIEKGVNLSHWLAQSPQRGAERAAKVTEADFRQMAALGLDHVRLPVDEEQLWTEDGTRHEDAFALLHEAVRWSLRHDLRIIVDLHVLRSHHFNVAKTRTLWREPAEQDKMVSMWTRLSRELRAYPLDRVAYEIMNEPASPTPGDWNRLMNRAIAEIRREEPVRVLLLGSRYGQATRTFKELEVPPGDPNLILSFHYYSPLMITHYRAPWSKGGGYAGPIAYPGQSVDPQEYASITSPELLATVKHNNGVFDRGTMEKDILEVVDLGKRLGLRVHCGEFGCYPKAPLELRQRWYRDIMSIFREHGIAWAPWNWKADFPIVNDDLTPIPELFDILMDREPAAPAKS